MISEAAKTQWIEEIAALPSSREMDNLDRTIFERCLDYVQDDAEVFRLIAECRSRFRFRPIACEITTVLEEITDPIKRLPPAQAEAYREYAPRHAAEIAGAAASLGGIASLLALAAPGEGQRLADLPPGRKKAMMALARIKLGKSPGRESYRVAVTEDDKRKAENAAASRARESALWEAMLEEVRAEIAREDATARAWQESEAAQRATEAAQAVPEAVPVTESPSALRIAIQSALFGEDWTSYAEIGKILQPDCFEGAQISNAFRDMLTEGLLEKRAGQGPSYWRLPASQDKGEKP